MSKKILILQSNYIPWKGYFDLINSVDEFIIYDHVQYTKNDWRNRNKIKTPLGVQWLAIPVTHSTSMSIKDVKVLNNLWRKKHWNTLKGNYTKAKYFKDYKDLFESLYLEGSEDYLSEINYTLLTAINKLLNIKTTISWSWNYKIVGENKIERLINVCKQAHGTEYLSGPAGSNYMDENLFGKNNIKVVWMDYNNYPIYNQLFPPFEHGVTILDLIFNEGPNANKFMKSFAKHEK
jgi:hypothetical protein